MNRWMYFHATSFVLQPIFMMLWHWFIASPYEAKYIWSISELHCFTWLISPYWLYYHLVAEVTRNYNAYCDRCICRTKEDRFWMGVLPNPHSFEQCNKYSTWVYTCVWRVNACITSRPAHISCASPSKEAMWVFTVKYDWGLRCVCLCVIGWLPHLKLQRLRPFGVFSLETLLQCLCIGIIIQQTSREVMVAGLLDTELPMTNIPAVSSSCLQQVSEFTSFLSLLWCICIGVDYTYACCILLCLCLRFILGRFWLASFVCVAGGSGRTGGGKESKQIIGSVILHDKLKYWKGSHSVHYHQGALAHEALCSWTHFHSVE